MEQDKKNYDVAVIGAGPSGMMAAISAAQNGAKVVLIEKNDSVGKKLLLTGGGRCNLTNAENDLRKLVANYGKTGAFLFHAFSEFGPKDVVEFFNNLGVGTVVENNQRVLTRSQNAQDVVDVLMGCLKNLDVKIIFGGKVADIKKENNLIAGIILENGEIIVAKNYVIAVGGKSYSQTGSVGDGYGWAHGLGHCVAEIAPALVPIKTKELWVKELSGVSLVCVGINVYQGKTKAIVSSGEMIFTHFGLSGPAILNISAKIGRMLLDGEVVISLNLLPQINREELEKKILQNFKNYPNKILKNCLTDFMPAGLVLAVAHGAVIDPIKTVNDITKEERRRLVDVIQNFKLTVASLMDLETAMITDGGVVVEEIDDKTMRSKIISNLFFAGEIIGVHGGTGGFNLQQCWSTGRLAGINAVGENLDKI